MKYIKNELKSQAKNEIFDTPQPSILRRILLTFTRVIDLASGINIIKLPIRGCRYPCSSTNRCVVLPISGATPLRIGASFVPESRAVNINRFVTDQLRKDRFLYEDKGDEKISHRSNRFYLRGSMHFSERGDHGPVRRVED